MQIAVFALAVHAFVAVPSAAEHSPLREHAPVPTEQGHFQLAQAADEDEPFGDPPPPPVLMEEGEAASAPALEPGPTVSPSREQRREERRQRREKAQQRRSPPRVSDDEPVDAMMAGIITAVGSVVVAVPAAGFCGICSCLACPGPLFCVPVATAASAAGGLMFAGADIGDAFLPAAAAGAISFGSGVLAIGTALLYSVATGAALGYAAGAPVDPNLTQGLTALNLLVYGGIVLGCLSLGAAGAGGAVYFLAGSGEDDEGGAVVRADPSSSPVVASAPRLPATTLATTTVAMAY